MQSLGSLVVQVCVLQLTRKTIFNNFFAIHETFFIRNAERKISVLSEEAASWKKIIRKLWKILSKIAHAQRLSMLRKVQIWLQNHISQHKSNSKRVLQKMFLKNLDQRFTVRIREDYLEILEYSLCLFLETGDKMSLVHLRDLWIYCVFGG